MNRLALLGGSFDPIHSGHLHIARRILALRAAPLVAFLPNARHNFKRDKVLLDFTRRCELVADALEPGMELWDDDATGSGYTADLLRRLYLKYPGREFLWVIGADNLAALPAWHDYDWLRRNVRFLIIPRPGYLPDPAVLKQIRRKTLKIGHCDISSTLVRERIARGQSIRGLVPEHLEQRIVNLYRPLLA